MSARRSPARPRSSSTSPIARCSCRTPPARCWPATRRRWAASTIRCRWASGRSTASADAPVFNYNPDLFWDADLSHGKAKIAAGPNNPVGLVWIDLSKEHYGIHGTPRPENVGKTQSHGCIRLTNWDAVELGGVGQGRHAGGAPGVARDRPTRSLRARAAGGRRPPTRAIRACGPAPATPLALRDDAVRRRSTCRPRCRRRACRIAPVGAPARRRPKATYRRAARRRWRRRRCRPGSPISTTLRGRRLALPVEGIDREHAARHLRRGAHRPRPRGDRHPGAARHAGRRGRGRPRREAVHQQARRPHHLPVRSERPLLLLLRASRSLCRRAWPRGSA